MEQYSPANEDIVIDTIDLGMPCTPALIKSSRDYTCQEPLEFWRAKHTNRHTIWKVFEEGDEHMCCRGRWTAPFSCRAIEVQVEMNCERRVKSEDVMKCS